MLGENIKKFRTAKGLSINALGKLCNVSAGYISDLEKDKKENPSRDILLKICGILDVKLEDLYSGVYIHTEEIANYEVNLPEMTERIKRMSKEQRQELLKIIQGMDSK